MLAELRAAHKAAHDAESPRLPVSLVDIPPAGWWKRARLLAKTKPRHTAAIVVAMGVLAMTTMAVILLRGPDGGNAGKQGDGSQPSVATGAGASRSGVPKAMMAIPCSSPTPTPNRCLKSPPEAPDSPRSGSDATAV